MTHEVPMTIFNKKLISKRLHNTFFLRNVLEVAPALLGKQLVRVFDDGTVRRFLITETEAYRGGDDLACHASRGKTPRNEVMFREGGLVYVYFVYGMHWMLNFVTGRSGDASAVLVRGLDGINGPGRVGKILQLDRSFYGEDLGSSQRIWIEDTDDKPTFTSLPRIGIHYAGEPWISMPWRFKIQQDK
jgi:DNA-3-methyladenine glycosylase